VLQLARGGAGFVLQLLQPTLDVERAAPACLRGVHGSTGKA
jgi:hypothetical protein